MGICCYLLLFWLNDCDGISEVLFLCELNEDFHKQRLWLLDTSKMGGLLGNCYDNVSSISVADLYNNFHGGWIPFKLNYVVPQ